MDDETLSKKVKETENDLFKEIDANDKWWDQWWNKEATPEEKEKIKGHYVLVHKQQIKYKSKSFEEIEEKATNLPNAVVYGIETEEDRAKTIIYTPFEITINGD